MKTALLATSLLLVSSAAFAADAVYDAPIAPSVQAPVYYSWSGAYAGIQGGAGWAKLKERIGSPSLKGSLDGGLLGGFVGYQTQFSNNFVLGIEGDLERNWNAKKQRLGGVEHKTALDITGSVRARAGYAIDRSLIYVTGGWAAARGIDEATGIRGTAKSKSTGRGWTIGAGIEQAFTDNLVGRLEYRYTDYGSAKNTPGRQGLDQHAVKVGLAVKF